MAKRRITFKALVIDALEKSLRGSTEPFVLRDASAGYPSSTNDGVTSKEINRAIDELRQPRSTR